MRTFLVVVFASLLFSCNTERDVSERNVLLTSTVWKEVGEVENTKPDGTIGFVSYKPDGTYEVVYQQAWKENDIVFRGTWKWISETEIATQFNEIIMEGISSKTDYKEDNYHIFRVTALSKDKLEGVGRHMLDAEDSGFAKPELFIASVK